MLFHKDVICLNVDMLIIFTFFVLFVFHSVATLCCQLNFFVL